MTENVFKGILATFGAVFGFMFGEVSTVFYVLCVLIVMDFGTGLLDGIVSKTLNSEICFKGIVKKIFIFCMVALAHLIDLAIGKDVAMNIVMFFYIANEGISLIENAAKAGLPVPQIIMDILEQLKDGGGEE